MFFLIYPLTERGRLYQAIEEREKGGKIKNKGIIGKKKIEEVEMQKILLLLLHFSFSPTFFILHNLTSLKEKWQTFRIQASKSHTANFGSLFPKLPFSCCSMACHLTSNIPLFA